MKVPETAFQICIVIVVFSALILPACAHDSLNKTVSETSNGILLLPFQSALAGSPDAGNGTAQEKTSGPAMQALSITLQSASSAPVDMTGIEWQKMLGGKWGDALFDIQPTGDGNYIAVGGSGSPDMTDDAGKPIQGYRGYIDGWVVKIDPSGTILWQYLFGGHGHDQAFSIRNTSDGGYVFAGYSDSTDGIFTSWNHGKEDGWVVKLDSAGKLQWQTLLGGSGNDRLMSVRQTTNNEYIVAGYTESADIPGAGSYHGNTDIFVAKLDSTGGVIWRKVIGGGNYDFGSSIIPASDRGYILTGYTESESISGSNTNHGYSDIVVMKLDEAGNLQWIKLLGGDQGEATAFDNAIQQTSDGGYILTGQTASSDSGDVTGATHGSCDVWVVKLDKSGKIEWQNHLGGTGCEDGENIQQTSYGDYILTGRTISDNTGDVGQNHGQWDAWVAKLDTNGQLLWQDVLGGSGYDQCSAIQPTSDEGFIVAVYTDSSNSGNIGPHHGYQDTWLAKLKPRLVVDVRDSDTHGHVPNAKAFLHDVAHDGDLNITAVNGRAVIADYGASNQYRFTKGSQYTVKATADKYRDGTPVKVVFTHDGQLVPLNLTATERPTIKKTFSITNVIYQDKQPTAASLLVADAVDKRLDPAGWDLVFSEQGPAVTPGYFGGISQQPASHSLNDATLHYHIGHGYFPDKTTGDTALSLLHTTELGTPGQYDGYEFKAAEIQNKWGGKNKWVVLQTCNTLKDTKWKTVMGTTHAIFGFATISDDNPDIPNYFFSNALEGKTLYYSWKSATIDALKNKPAATQFNPDGTLDVTRNTVDMVAAAYFKTPTQKSMDHLPDKGDIAPDGGPDDEPIPYAWNCHTGDDVIL
jgi:hypothetical protein